MSLRLDVVLSNVTQEAEVLNVLYGYAAKIAVPETLLESFLFG